MTWFQRFMNWFEPHLPLGVNNWPIQQNEMLAGLYLVLVGAPSFWLNPKWALVYVIAAFVVVTILSYFYEHGTPPWRPPASPKGTPDPHGWNPVDFWWRVMGCIVVLQAWVIVHLVRLT